MAASIMQSALGTKNLEVTAPPLPHALAACSPFSPPSQADVHTAKSQCIVMCLKGEDPFIATFISQKLVINGQRDPVGKDLERTFTTQW